MSAPAHRIDVVDRQYTNYRQYIEHQAQKYDEILANLGGFSNRKIADFRLLFFDSLRPLKSLVPRDAKVICVGARQGTEVEVLRDIGFPNAVGVDLNPGPENPYVAIGDFMNHDIRDESFDALYSNAIDHAFDLDAFFREQARIVKKGGYALFDIACSPPSYYEAQDWKSSDEPVSVLRQYFMNNISDRRVGRWRKIIVQKPD